jgi:hypothetical protein
LAGFFMGCSGHAAIDPCPRCRDEKRTSEGLVFWDCQLLLRIGSAWAIVSTGKCDVCRSFTFWCRACGDKKVVPDGTSHECGCEWQWFIERTADEVSFVFKIEDGEIPLNRRPLR